MLAPSRILEKPDDLLNGYFRFIRLKISRAHGKYAGVFRHACTRQNSASCRKMRGTSGAEIGWSGPKV